MYVVANRVPVQPDWREEFETGFRARVGKIDKVPGFVSMQVMRPADEDSPYVILTTWRNKEAFDGWVGSDDFREAHSNPMPQEAYSGEGRLERHEVVVSAPAD